ncbi:MAG: prenyltransferase/squalene oxidase repeat-containing protein, partial [Planctomycetota bacterium]
LAATQAQQPPDNEGGWNYTSPGASADISTTHFAVSGMAAAAALNEVAALAVERSVPVLRRNFEVHGGAFGYRNAVNQAPSTSMTAAGVWMHLLAGTPPNDPDVTTALAWLAENYLPDGMVGPFEGTSNYYAMWTQAKAFTALGDFVEGIPGALNPVALGYADHPPGWWFDFSATLLGWQDVEGQWGTQANGSDRGWSQMSSHLFAILTLQKTLGLVPVAPDAGPPACFDGVDNDRDGLADDEDPDCAVACRPTERPLPTCSNFADDDGDGRADYPDDPGCTHPGDLDETSPACADGRDNDGDDRIDFPADPGCTGFRDDAEADPDGPAPACANGEDDDGDGETDFPADPDCVNARQDFESPERLCGDATVLGVLPAGASRLLGDTGDGENALAGECGGVAGREVVYALVADGPERVTLSTIDDDTLVDTVLFVRSACEDAETELACSDDVGDDPRSSATAILPEAGLYFVVVDARIGRGEFALNVTRTPIGGGLPACVDRADNDGDGRFDLVDPGCTAPGDDDETDPDEPPACSNGADDDDDGLADLEDPGCAAAGDDDEADPEEPPACSNGVDDDADGHTDWPADNGCLGPGGETEFGTIRARCNNGIDDDNDGAIDYPVDPGCIARTDDTEDSPARACGNEVDDDQDGVADYPFDPGCAAAGDADEADPDPLPACANGEDDDEDGATDYPFDPGCLAAGDDDEANAGVTRCSNGFDDDNDGAIDYPDDTGCSSAADDDEAGGGRNARCADGADNDGDGLRDAADPGCEDADDNDETDPVAVPECANQADDDNDGLVDWPEDPGCLAAGGTESHACVARQAQAVPAGGVFVANINQNTPDDYRHSCGGNGVGEQVYVYTLDAPASLLISADDPGRTLDPVISVRRTCEELRSEVGCGRPDAPEVVIPDAEAGEYYIFVSADVLTGVASSGEPIEMPAQPRVYNPRDDVNANCLSDGGNDAFDCYGRLTLFRGAASVVQDISPGEKQTVVDGVEYTLTTDFAAPGVYRYRIDGPPGETVGVGVAGNLGSDGGTNVETYEAAVGNTPVFYARTTDNLENPRDPPVYTMVVPSSPVDAGGAAYAFNGDNLTYSQAGLALPITIYIAWTYAEREGVEAAILSDLVELNGGDGVGAVEVTVEAR